jgi:hypothetical protein
MTPKHEGGRGMNKEWHWVEIIGLTAVVAGHRQWLSGEGGRRADLSGANLTDANLSGTRLTGADLTSARLTGADLSGANLTDANLSGTRFWRARLLGADLTYADLTGARLTGADLTGADLTGARPGLLVPRVEGLVRQILDLVEADGQALDMARWHTCETTHCLAGWGVSLGGEEGRALERKIGAGAAGALIWHSSTGRVPNFYATTERALVDLRAHQEDK